LNYLYINCPKIAFKHTGQDKIQITREGKFISLN